MQNLNLSAETSLRHALSENGKAPAQDLLAQEEDLISTVYSRQSKDSFHDQKLEQQTQDTSSARSSSHAGSSGPAIHNSAPDANPPSPNARAPEAGFPLSDITYDAAIDEFVHHSASSRLIPYDPTIHSKRLVYDPAEWMIVDEKLRFLPDGSCVGRRAAKAARVFKRADRAQTTNLERSSSRLSNYRVIERGDRHILLPIDDESREVFLENYSFLKRADGLDYLSVGLQERFQVTTKICRLGCSKIFVDKKRDTFLIKLPVPPGLLRIDFSQVKYMAFHGPDNFTPPTLALVSPLTSGWTSLQAVDFILGGIYLDDDIWYYKCHLLEIDHDFMHMECGNASWDRYPHIIPRAQRRLQLAGYMDRADQTRETYANFTQSNGGVWRGIKMRVSMMTQIIGAAHDPRDYCYRNFIPRNPRYSGVCFSAKVDFKTDAQLNEKEIHQLYIETLDCVTPCSYDGALCIRETDYSGLGDLMDGKWI
ncbi:uncharacterized protein LY89DRAFT_742738 [Mollisia scopiformis]|uniref:Uncharacterized protein n=1 Tax=Mollisia scopiformis TaxID=149040 RepID=A0A132B521_MOLSC|nr:uncharacterized protein LY89DRAFT_742738 [Mollisia scopiformis]KUJ07502.1 hypothetical protein LY89DRAFT_742738 [Mollisia scopiformis]